MTEKYFNNHFFVLYFFPFILGSLTVLSFQPFNFTLINFIILPLFFLLINFVNKKSKNKYRKKPYKKNLFILGTLFGFGFYLSNLYWISHSLTFDDSFKFLIPFSLILIPLFLSLFYSLVVLFVGPYLRTDLTSIFLFSSSLAISDFLRAKILSGFPWNLWAYSFSWATEIIQFLNISGLFSFNLIIITIFLLPLSILFKSSTKKKFLSFTLIILILFTLYIYGNHTLNKNDKNPDLIKSSFNIKVIAPNFPLEYGLSYDKILLRLNKLIRYSEPDANLKTLFIWPEGVFSGYSFNEILEFKKVISKNFNKNHFILFGVNRYNKKMNGFYNSIVLVNKDMKILQEYKKQKLVPFGEFLPFEDILNKFGFKKVTEGYGAFLKGEEKGNLKIEELNILPLICYEIIFTEFIQRTDKNINLIVNISEDGWFGNSIGPYQHFAKAIFRAVEQNSFLIRSTNKGISAIINNKGEILKKINPNEAGNIELQVPLIESKNKNKNDLIFFTLLITYIVIFIFYRRQ